MIKTMNNYLKRLLMMLFVTAIMMLPGCTGRERSEAVKAVSEAYRVPDDKQLIVYTSHKEEVYLPIIREFENRTGIWVEIHAGGTAEMFDAVRKASAEGACDIMFGGGIESYEARKDLFMTYESSEKADLDAEYLSSDNIWTPFTELPLVFIYNKKLVSEIEAPKTWSDFFDEKWKGQIAFADLHNSGTSYTILSTIPQVLGESVSTSVPAFIDQLDNRILSSSKQIIPFVSNGNYTVGITLEETALKGIRSGYDIAMIYPEDGTSKVPDGCAMVVNAPHSYNAGLFIDFVVGADTQKYAMDEFCRRPVRKDTEPAEGFGEFKSFNFDIEKSAKDESLIFDLWDDGTAGSAGRMGDSQTDSPEVGG